MWCVLKFKTKNCPLHTTLIFQAKMVWNNFLPVLKSLPSQYSQKYLFIPKNLLTVYHKIASKLPLSDVFKHELHIKALHALIHPFKNPVSHVSNYNAHLTQHHSPLRMSQTALRNMSLKLYLAFSSNKTDMDVKNTKFPSGAIAKDTLYEWEQLLVICRRSKNMIIIATKRCT